MEKTVKETFISFSNLEVHCCDIAKVKSTDERKKFFGIAPVLTLFVVCNLTYSLIG